jgi:hypothetical protein
MRAWLLISSLEPASVGLKIRRVSFECSNKIAAIASNANSRFFSLSKRNGGKPQRKQHGEKMRCASSLAVSSAARGPSPYISGNNVCYSRLVQSYYFSSSALDLAHIFGTG